jgi:AsmA protein
MPKPLKYVLIAIGTLLALLVALVIIVAATFDPNDYKPLLIRLVQEKTQRTLKIPGEIKLTFFPKIGADLGKVSLSEHKGPDEFASVNHAQVSLELMPMLSNRFVVDRVMIDGLNVNIRKNKDGTTNIDDLMSPNEGEAQQVEFNIDGVSVTNAAFTYRDEQSGRTVMLTDLDLATGPIANGRNSSIDLTGQLAESSIDAAVRLDIKSGMRLDFDKKHFVISNLDAKVDGKALGYNDLRLAATGNADIQTATNQFALDDLRLGASARKATQVIDLNFTVPKLALTENQITGSGLTGGGEIVDGARTIAVKLAAPAFEGSPKAFRISSVTLDAAINEPTLNAKATLTSPLQGEIDKLLFRAPQLVMTLDGQKDKLPVKGTVRTALTADLGAGRIDLGNLGIDLLLPNPGGGTLDFKAKGNASANLGKESVQAALAGTLDGAALDAKLGMTGFATPAYNVDARIASLDLDRYLAQGGRTTPAKAESAPDTKAGPEEPIDLSVLKTLNATGKLQIGSLKVSNIKASDVRVGLSAKPGRADISPLSAKLYGGTLSGSLSAVATGQPRFTIKQTLSNVNIGPLLKDVADKDILDGRGKVVLDLTTTGNTVSQLKKSVNGAAQLNLQDGAIRGVNIASAIRQAKAKIGVASDAASQGGAPAAAENTDFTALTANFRIANGIARNDDLEMKSPLLRVTGSGEVNLGEDRLDYLMKATVVSTLQGQGGPELQALRGVTVPVQLTGPYSDIAWKVDVAAMASELAKGKIEEKKEEVKAEVQKRVEEQKGKIEEELRGRLKGLLGQ